MAPIKFEDNIKEKLEQRELQPSHSAWDKLSTRLDNEPQKKRFGYWWLGVAASVIGIAIVSLVMLNTEEANITNPILVEDQLKPNDNTNDNDAIEVVIQEDDKALQNDSQVPTENIAIANNNDEIKTSKKQREQPKVVLTETYSKKESVTAQKEPVNDLESLVATQEIQENKILNKEAFEDVKVNEVVAQIQQLQKEQPQVTEAEINALLKQAQNDIVKQHIYDASTKTVDAEALLLDVEMDLEDSFRDRVFEALKSGYKEVKTVLAERNN